MGRIKILKASSLVEIIVSIVIIMAAFMIGSIIFLQVMHNGRIYEKMNAIVKTNQLASETLSENKINDTLIEYQGLTLYRSASKGRNKNRVMIEIISKDDNQHVIFIRKLYIRKED